MIITITPEPAPYPMLLDKFYVYVDVADDGYDGILGVYITTDGSEPNSSNSYGQVVYVDAGAIINVRVVDNQLRTYSATKVYPGLQSFSTNTLSIKDITDSVRPVVVQEQDGGLLTLTAQIYNRMSAVEAFSFPDVSTVTFPYATPILNMVSKSKLLMCLESNINCSASVSLRLVDKNSKAIVLSPINMSCNINFPDYGSGIPKRLSAMQEFDTLGAIYAGLVIHSTNSTEGLTCRMAGV